MPLRVIYVKTRPSKQRHITFWTLNTHNIQFTSLQRPVFAVCVYGHVFYLGLVFLVMSFRSMRFLLHVYRLCPISVSMISEVILNHKRQKWKNYWEWQGLEGKKKLFSLFLGHHVVQSVHICHAHITVVLLLAVQHSSQKFPLLVESACLSLCVHFICLATLGLSLHPSPQSLLHPTSISFSVQNSYASIFYLAQQSHSSPCM
jgi:hypothetical protein